MTSTLAVIPLAEHRDILAQIVELLRSDPSDVQAANFVLSLVERQIVSAEVAHELYKEAILRVYLGGEDEG